MGDEGVMAAPGTQGARACPASSGLEGRIFKGGGCQTPHASSGREELQGRAAAWRRHTAGRHTAPPTSAPLGPRQQRSTQEQ